MVKKIEYFYAELRKVRKQLERLGDMRPGTLSRQSSKAGGKKYFQVSFTYKMKSRTESVRLDQVKRIKAEILEYKKFKKLMQQWIDLSLALSKRKSEIAKL